MPLLRRDESPDPLAPQILLLWQKKWLILGIGFLTAVVTFVALLFVKPSFQVTAEVFVNRLPSVPEGETPNPDTVASLLKSSSVLGKVRDDFVRKFNEEPPPIERFVKAFSIKSTVLQDTTVRKELSPVLQLEVESEGAEQTRFIMESWVRHFIADFGNYMVQEALVKKDAYMQQKDALEQEMLAVSRQMYAVEARLPLIRKNLAEKLDQLSPARLRTSSAEEESNTVQFIIQAPRMMPGLLERFSEIRLRERAGTASTTAPAEMRALSMAIQDVNTSVAQIEVEYAETLAEDARLTREMKMLTETRKAIDEAITRFTVASAVYRAPQVEGLPAGGDIRALSMPVLPEQKVWPKRSIAAVIAGIVGVILGIFFVLFRSYMQKLTSLRAGDLP